MDEKNKKCGGKSVEPELTEEEKSADTLPGVAIDIADDEKVSKKAIKERTEALNNNPENNGKII